MAIYGKFKFAQAVYGTLPPFHVPTVGESGIAGTPSLSSPDHIMIVGTMLPGVTATYIDGNVTIQNSPFSINDTENTILNANRDEAIQGATELSTIAMGEIADPTTEVSMDIQGLVSITIPYAGSRFSRN